MPRSKTPANGCGMASRVVKWTPTRRPDVHPRTEGGKKFTSNAQPKMTENQSTVLVAEDSRTQAVQLQWLLEKAGFRAVVTSNGREALDAIRQSPPDLLVTDLEMPEMNGLELVEAVHAEFPKIPIVLATAVGSEVIAAEALRKGAASYVPKRFLDDLIPTLQRLLAVVQADRANSKLADCMIQNEVRFCLPNENALVGPLVAQLTQMIERFGLRDGNGTLRVGTALDEALQNAIVHGNLEVSSKLREEDEADAYRNLVKQHLQESPYKERRTHVRACVGKDSAEFVIRDEGPGFDPTAIPDPTNPVYFDRPCGRGLWLIHAFMDEVRHNDQGNEITMIIRKQAQ
jgi:CheY-like chemotaxis protein/anti-sigma regulatory factor (Ser/Thr protein kinase)